MLYNHVMEYFSNLTKNIYLRILNAAALSKIYRGVEAFDKNMYDKALENFEDALSVCRKFNPEQKHLTTADALVP